VKEQFWEVIAHMKYNDNDFLIKSKFFQLKDAEEEIKRLKDEGILKCYISSSEEEGGKNVK
jgi:hypothetical protein